MRRFGYGIIVGFFAVFAVFVGCYTAVATFAPASLPAPAITRLNLLNEKLRFLREHPAFDPTVLAVGSSITWRQLSGKAFEPLAGGPDRFLNGATGYLRIHQTRALADFYLAHFRHVRTLLVMVSLPDFRDCANEPADLFDPKDAARYAFKDWPPLYFYVRYFTPRRYIKMAMTLKRRKTPFAGDFYLDRYGSGPVWLPATVRLGLRYGGIKPDPACVKALGGLVRDMRRRGIDLVLVFTPIHPEYRTRYPASIAWLARLASELPLEQSPKAGGPRVLDYIRDRSFTPQDFFDAFHLQWPAAKKLSARIARAIQDSPFAPPPDEVLSKSAIQRRSGS